MIAQPHVSISNFFWKSSWYPNTHNLFRVNFEVPIPLHDATLPIRVAPEGISESIRLDLTLGVNGGDAEEHRVSLRQEAAIELHRRNKMTGTLIHTPEFSVLI